jgi:hypothetical protein
MFSGVVFEIKEFAVHDETDLQNDSGFSGFSGGAARSEIRGASIVPGSKKTCSTNIPIITGNSSVFYRIRHP